MELLAVVAPLIGALVSVVPLYGGDRSLKRRIVQTGERAPHVKNREIAGAMQTAIDQDAALLEARLNARRDSLVAAPFVYIVGVLAFAGVGATVLVGDPSTAIFALEVAAVLPVIVVTFAVIDIESKRVKACGWLLQRGVEPPKSQLPVPIFISGLVLAIAYVWGSGTLIWMCFEVRDGFFDWRGPFGGPFAGGAACLVMIVVCGLSAVTELRAGRRWLARYQDASVRDDRMVLETQVL